MFFIIGIAAVLVYGGLVYYIGWRGYRWLRPEKSTRRFKLLYAAVVTFVATAFMFGRMSGSIVLGKLGAYWMAIFCLLLLLVPVAHLTVIVLRYTRLPRHGTQRWAGIATLALTVSLMLYGTYNAYNPVVRTYAIQLEGGEAAGGSLRIAMAADMHFGLLSGKDHAERLVREVNALKPDIILLPGDLFDDDIQPFLDQRIDQSLSKLQAPYGIYATLGNHDRHDGSVERLIATLTDSGIRVLYDEAMTVDDRFTIVGRRDYSDSGRQSLEEVMRGADQARPVILMEHQPNELDIAERAGVDLMLSGHTHRGQVFPGSIITNLIYENDWGLLRRGEFHSIVTQGYGFWGPPIRLGTRSEIVLIEAEFV